MSVKLSWGLFTCCTSLLPPLRMEIPSLSVEETMAPGSPEIRWFISGVQQEQWNQSTDRPSLPSKQIFLIDDITHLVFKKLYIVLLYSGIFFKKLNLLSTLQHLWIPKPGKIITFLKAKYNIDIICFLISQTPLIWFGLNLGKQSNLDPVIQREVWKEQ